MFPFGRDSSGSRSIVEYLYSNLNYKTKITLDGTYFIHHCYDICEELLSISHCSGVVIYKVLEDPLGLRDARAVCDQDSEAVVAAGFLHLPMPQSEGENQVYRSLIAESGEHVWLDIDEVMPRRSPRTWVYRDGSPVTWFNWDSGEPNNSLNSNENQVEMKIKNGKWNDRPDNADYRAAVCSYFLPAGAENDCNWLREFEN